MRVRLTSHLSLVLVSFVAAACGSKVLKNAEQLLELGQCDQAHRILEKFVQEDPQNSDAFILLGDARFCLAEKIGKRKKQGQELLRLAIEAYESALKLEPDSRSAVLHLGIAQMGFSRGEDPGSVKAPLETLRAGFKHHPKDVALREYLGVALWWARYLDPSVSEELAILVQSLNVGEGWQQLPAYQQRDKRAHGTFIVTKVKAPLQKVQGGDGGTLAQWDVLNFSGKKGDSLHFIDMEHPETEMRIGYSPAHAFRMYENCHIGEMANRNSIVFAEPNGAEIGKNSQGRIHWARTIGENRIPGWRFDYCKVEYAWEAYSEKLIQGSDVVRGVGNKAVDKARAEVFAKVGAKLDPRLLARLLNGELRPGLPHVLVSAVLGSILPPFVFTGGVLSQKKVRSTVQVGGLILTYEDGRLSSWKGEWRSGAEDQDNDSQ